MRRIDWVIAAALVAIGLSCLVTAAIGYSNSTMAGMMFWMPLSMYFSVFVRMIIVVALLFFVYEVFKHRSQKCPRCHRTVRSEWKVCPHCEANLKADK